MANLLLFLLPTVLGLLVPQPARAYVTNYLLSGEFLIANNRLSYGKYDFVMEENCNAVLYNGDWESNSTGTGEHCRLTLNNYGQLFIQTWGGKTVWRSGPAAPKCGQYAAVLHPEGKVIIYGPDVWTAEGPIARPIRAGDVRLQKTRLENIPLISNLLFSGQVVYDDGKLVEKKYTLVMQGDCNLVMYDHQGTGSFWQSNTHANGKYCFLRLDHKGTLTIKDDAYNTIWTRGGTDTEGDYVFILQNNGKSVVYGPAIWATAPLTSKLPKPREIAMVTSENAEK